MQHEEAAEIEDGLAEEGHKPPKPAYSSRFIKCPTCGTRNRTEGVQLYTAVGFRQVWCIGCKGYRRAKDWHCQCGVAWHRCGIHSVDPPQPKVKVKPAGKNKEERGLLDPSRPGPKYKPPREKRKQEKQEAMVEWPHHRSTSADRYCSDTEIILNPAKQPKLYEKAVRKGWKVLEVTESEKAIHSGAADGQGARCESSVQRPAVPNKYRLTKKTSLKQKHKSVGQQQLGGKYRNEVKHTTPSSGSSERALEPQPKGERPLPHGPPPKLSRLSVKTSESQSRGLRRTFGEVQEAEREARCERKRRLTFKQPQRGLPLVCLHGRTTPYLCGECLSLA